MRPHGGINLAQGVCDTPVPDVVEAAAIEAIREGQNIYTRCDGIARLREAIAAKQQRDYGLTYDAENEVMVASGATAGLHAAAMALLNPGDEVLVFEPFYGYHVHTLDSLRVNPVLVALAEPDWQLDVDAMRAAITPRTRAILLNTPANPQRKIFTLPELEAVAQLAIEHDLFLITDEIYEYFVYDGARHICPATLPGMRERTIVISGFSKTFSITGWRIGYATADARWMPTMAHFHDLTYVCAPAPLQVGAAAGLEQLPPSFYKQLAADHQSKRGRLSSALERRRHGAVGASRRLLHHGQRRALARQNGRREGAALVELDRRGRRCRVGLLPQRARRESAALLLCQAG